MARVQSPNYAVIDCAIKEPSIPCFNRLVTRTNLPFTYHTPPSMGMNTLLEVENFKAIVVFGSYSNVSDDLPWQRELAEFLKERILDGVPTMGICFGHQLIAHAFGAEIGPVEKKEGFEGVREIEMLESKWNLCKRDKHVCVVSHRQELKSLPVEFCELATSPECKYEMVCHEHLPFLGIQGHPEATLNFVNTSLEKPISEEEFQLHQKHGDRIIDGFLTIAERF